MQHPAFPIYSTLLSQCRQIANIDDTRVLLLKISIVRMRFTYNVRIGTGRHEAV